MGDSTPTEVVADAVETASSPLIPDPIVDTSQEQTAPTQHAVDTAQDVERTVRDAVSQALHDHVSLHHSEGSEHSHGESHDDGGEDQSPVRKPWTHRFG